MPDRPDLTVLQPEPQGVPLGKSLAGKEAVTLARDCDAVLIPSGEPTRLPAGSRVTITQQLGGDFTVMTSWGYLARIAAQDADALGKAAPLAPAAAQDAAAPLSEDRVWDQLRTIYDPEIPVNIVDLGLIYACRATPLPDGGHRVDVRMTLTAPGCGMGQVLKNDVERKVAALPGVREVGVELVFDPPWSRSMMSEVALLELGLM